MIVILYLGNGDDTKYGGDEQFGQIVGKYSIANMDKAGRQYGPDWLIDYWNRHDDYVAYHLDEL